MYITKLELDELAKKYETKDFIKEDPVQFPNRFKNVKDIEIAGFVSSMFAYGNRKIFISKLNELFDIMENQPLDYVLNFDKKSLKGFNYRFSKDFDIIEIFNVLKKLYGKDGGLNELFKYGYDQKKDVMPMFQAVTDYFYANRKNEVGQGFYHMIPNPSCGGAMKRMNMFLRWMVRKPPVDLNIWHFIPTSELLIPLDVHVAKISREMGLLKRNSNDFKAVVELTNNLRKFCPEDPVKYDFAIFGL